MICMLCDDDAVGAGRSTRKPQRQIIRLRSRAGKHDVAVTCDLSAERANKIFGVIENAVLQISRMRAQRCHLTRDRFGDVTISVPQRNDIVICVKILPTFLIVEKNAVAANHVNRIGIEMPVGRSQ